MIPRNYRPRKPVTPTPGPHRAMVFCAILAAAFMALAAALISGGM